MSMSTHIVGFRPPDGQWKKMKRVYEACVSAGVEVPETVMEYFEWNEEAVNGPGMEVEIKAEKYTEDSKEGFVVDVKSLPEGVRYIRFYNSW